MADSRRFDIKQVLSDVLDKLTSLGTKMTAVERELSDVKVDQQRLHDAVNNIQTQPENQAGVLELRFPEYDGKDDPAIWIHRCELFFRLQRTVGDDKVWLAAFHMNGAAYDWYRYLESNHGGVLTWPQLAESVRRRFGALTRGNALGDLVQLRHTGSVAEYGEEFLRRLNRCDVVKDWQQVAFFTAGLRDPLSYDVDLQRPETLEDAMILALALERRLQL